MGDDEIEEKVLVTPGPTRAKVLGREMSSLRPGGVG